MKQSLLLQGGDAFDLESEIARFKPKTADICLRFQGGELKPQALEELLFSPSFFSETFVVIENAQELGAKAQELVIAFAKKPMAKVTLLVHVAAKSDLGKYMEQVVLPEVKPWDKQGKIAEWIASYLKAQNIKVSPQVVAFIAATGTTDRFFLREELNKLIMYVGDKHEITMSDVKAISAFEHEETVWQLSDAFLQRDKQKSVKLLQHLLQQQVSPFLLVRQLRNSCHQALMMVSLQEAGVHNVQEHFPQLRGGVFDKNFKLAKEAGRAFLTKSLLLLDKTERALKDSPFDESTLLLKVFTV